MNNIEIDEEVQKALAMMARTFELNENDVIRKLLQLPARSEKIAKEESRSESGRQYERDALVQMVWSSVYKSSDAKQKYFAILGFLYLSNPRKFEEFDCFRQRNRILIAKDQKMIEKSGESTNPQRLGTTPYFLLTTLSNLAKRTILQTVLFRFEYSPEVIKMVLETLPDAPNGKGRKSFLNEYAR